MKVYLAHNYAARWWLKDYVVLLESLGHFVTSLWITDDSQHNDLEEDRAKMDLRNIDEADALILFTDQYTDKPGKGKFIEFGYALAKGKLVFIHGRDVSSSVFYHLPQVRVLKLISDINDIDYLALRDSVKLELK